MLVVVVGEELLGTTTGRVDELGEGAEGAGADGPPPLLPPLLLPEQMEEVSGLEKKVVPSIWWQVPSQSGEAKIEISALVWVKEEDTRRASGDVQTVGRLPGGLRITV